MEQDCASWVEGYFPDCFERFQRIRRQIAEGPVWSQAAIKTTELDSTSHKVVIPLAQRTGSDSSHPSA